MKIKQIFCFHKYKLKVKKPSLYTADSVMFSDVGDWDECLWACSKCGKVKHTFENRRFQLNSQENEYEKALDFLVNLEMMPCEVDENCFKCEYCKKHCSNGDKKCWKNYIENFYKGENKK